MVHGCRPACYEGGVSTCPLCKGIGIIPRHPHPQNTSDDQVCPVCYGSGEVEEIATKKSILKIYKYHGVYSAYAQDAELTAFTALDSDPFI